MPNCFLPLKPGQQLVVLYETKRGDRNLEQFPSVRRDQCLHERGAEARAAPANRDGTICWDVAGSSGAIVLYVI